MNSQIFSVGDDQAGCTLAAALRVWLPGQSWKSVRQLVSSRHVLIRDEVCLDPARRLPTGEVVEVRSRSAPRLPSDDTIKVRYADKEVVVVEKPTGVCTVRHPSERDWPERRKQLSPTLEDLVPRILRRMEKHKSTEPGGRLRVVQRLDKLTSGLLVFARTVAAERALGKQFHRHTVLRRYMAIVVGIPPTGRVATNLARDRGDGRRGSTTVAGLGKPAVTHVEILERLGRFTLISCRLETGRTHQIRIHLAELGHPVCGEPVYRQRLDGSVIGDDSAAPRMSLHAAELGFVHPTTGKTMDWSMPLPADLRQLLESLRSRKEHGKGRLQAPKTNEPPNESQGRRK
jgi:23S rRNA pseudouridine1911/1915/1917 synthase